jgi:hypothetical protein
MDVINFSLFLSIHEIYLWDGEMEIEPLGR